MKRDMVWTPCHLVTLSLFLLAPASAHAQLLGVSNVRGTYHGFFIEQDNALDPACTPVRLDITTQDQRSFTGELTLGILDPLCSPIKGTIAASGVCTCVSAGGELKLVYSADWLSLGDGAASLRGELSFREGDKDKNFGTLVLLRAFTLGDRPPVAFGNDWIGEFQSVLGPQVGSVTLITDILDGTSNTFTGTLVLGSRNGGEVISSDVVGTVNADGRLVAVGGILTLLGDASFMMLDGSVRFDREGPVFEGTYLIESTAGKVLDAGIMSANIGSIP